MRLCCARPCVRCAIHGSLLLLPILPRCPQGGEGMLSRPPPHPGRKAKLAVEAMWPRAKPRSGGSEGICRRSQSSPLCDPAFCFDTALPHDFALGDTTAVREKHAAGHLERVMSIHK